MRYLPHRARALALLSVLLLIPAFAPLGAQDAAQRAVALDDILAWKNISTTSLSNDGQWFAYRMSPGEGDSQLVVRRTHDPKEMKFEIGEAPAGGGGRGGGASSSLAFSDEGKWVAFSTYPTRREGERMRRQRRPIQPGVAIVNLANGEKVDVPKVRRFAFSGESGAWIALHRAPAQANGGGGGAAAAGRGGAPGGGAAAANQPKGTDLILRELATGQELNVGNVSGFEFSKDGRFLALTIDAADKVGNGVQVRDLSNGTVTVLDSGEAVYERLNWTEKGDALAVLKGTEDKALKDKVYTVLGFTGFGDGAPKKVAYAPASDTSFPEGMAVSPNRDPEWTDDRQALLFGIHVPEPKDTSAAQAPEGEGAAAAPAGGSAPDGAGANADEKVDLVLWHWKDPRLQTQQQVQEQRDRDFSYLAEYRIQPAKFIRLADDDVRTVTPAPKDRFAVGIDEREFELMGNMDGRRYQDVYAINLETGERTVAAKRVRWFNGPSPDGESLLYLRGRQLHGPLDEDRPDPQHHAGRARLVRGHGRRSQRRQAADLRRRLGERQQVGAPQRQLGHLAGAGRGRAVREPHGQRPQGRHPVPEPLRARAGPGPRNRHRPDQAAVLPRLRRMDEEGRDRPPRPGQARAADGAVE